MLPVDPIERLYAERNAIQARLERIIVRVELIKPGQTQTNAITETWELSSIGTWDWSLTNATSEMYYRFAAALFEEYEANMLMNEQTIVNNQNSLNLQLQKKAASLEEAEQKKRMLLEEYKNNMAVYEQEIIAIKNNNDEDNDIPMIKIIESIQNVELRKKQTTIDYRTNLQKVEEKIAAIQKQIGLLNKRTGVQFFVQDVKEKEMRVSILGRDLASRAPDNRIIINIDTLGRFLRTALGHYAFVEYLTKQLVDLQRRILESQHIIQPRQDKNAKIQQAALDVENAKQAYDNITKMVKNLEARRQLQKEDRYNYKPEEIKKAKEEIKASGKLRVTGKLRKKYDDASNISESDAEFYIGQQLANQINALKRTQAEARELWYKAQGALEDAKLALEEDSSEANMELEQLVLLLFNRYKNDKAVTYELNSLVHYSKQYSWFKNERELLERGIYNLETAGEEKGGEKMYMEDPKEVAKEKTEKREANVNKEDLKEKEEYVEGEQNDDDQRRDRLFSRFKMFRDETLLYNPLVVRIDDLNEEVFKIDDYGDDDPEADASRAALLQEIAMLREQLKIVGVSDLEDILSDHKRFADLYRERVQLEKDIEKLNEAKNVEKLKEKQEKLKFNIYTERVMVYDLQRLLQHLNNAFNFFPRKRNRQLIAFMDQAISIIKQMLDYDYEKNKLSKYRGARNFKSAKEQEEFEIEIERERTAPIEPMDIEPEKEKEEENEPDKPKVDDDILQLPTVASIRKVIEDIRKQIVEADKNLKEAALAGANRLIQRYTVELANLNIELEKLQEQEQKLGNLKTIRTTIKNMDRTIAKVEEKRTEAANNGSSTVVRKYDDELVKLNEERRLLKAEEKDLIDEALGRDANQVDPKTVADYKANFGRKKRGWLKRKDLGNQIKRVY